MVCCVLHWVCSQWHTVHTDFGAIITPYLNSVLCDVVRNCANNHYNAIVQDHTLISVNNVITIQLWAHMRTAQNKTGVHKLQKNQSETCTVSIVITAIDRNG